jgi:AraC-like DNA-binding protein
MNERILQRECDNRAELVDRISHKALEDGVVEPLPGVHMARASRALKGVHGVFPTALCVIAQGAKEVFVGDSMYTYDPNNYLLATVELPAVSRIKQASFIKPYLSLRINLDPALVASVMVEAGMGVPRGQADAKGFAVSTLTTDLLDACVRLVSLIDSPSEARVLVPLIKREIVFRLLMGEQGPRLRYLPALGSDSHSIARALEILRKEYDHPLRIEEIARELGMSASGFHHRFKAVTDMSPIQFQKQLRLQQARKLMVGENMDAATAGFRVGYSDASHFSRDYKKHFGDPPARDVEQVREATRPNSNA